MSFPDAENIYICLNAGLANEKVYRHFDACKQRAVFQNLLVIFRCLAAACGVLDDDCGVAPAHHGKGFFNENHSIARRGIRRIQNKRISREFFIRFAKAIVAVKLFQRVFVQNIRTAVTHQNHVEDGKHIHL